MYSEVSTVMHGDWSYIWQLSSEIEHWAERLPHYRKVVIHEMSADKLEKRAYMSAVRDILPVSWHTIQRLKPSDNPSEARILFKHVGGVTVGMEVEWLFEDLGNNNYKVTITHDWLPSWPIVNKVGAWLITELVVNNIAPKTLAHIRKMALEQTGSLASNR